MTALPTHPLRIADLATRKATPFALHPDTAEMRAIAAALSIEGVRKLRFTGEIRPEGRHDWVLMGELGATVTQECVVTLAPVTTRIDEVVQRSYLAQMPDPGPGEVEMPDDDTVDPLPEVLDVAAVMIEALSLALPPFPRAADVAFGVEQFAAPGVTPMTDDDAKPFANLKDLRATLEKKGNDGAD